MSQIKNNLGWALFLILSFLPVFLWLLAKPLDARFISLATTLTSFGQLTGLVGMAMFSLVLFLSGGPKFLEDYFAGVNKAYKAHHFFGGLAFVLLLFHPLFLAVKYLLVSARSAALFLLPGTDWTINFGILALLLLMILLVFTFFIKLPYDRWRLTHRFLGFSFFLASLHAFFIQSDISRYLPLRIYMPLLSLTGLSFYLCRLISRFLKRESQQ